MWLVSLYGIKLSYAFKFFNRCANWRAHFSSSFTLNELISSNLKGYTIERLNKIDLAIIILAVIELNYLKENTKEVIINEAVELAKKYSTNKSPKFINGFLASISN